jgi:hypothetical protein
MPGGRPAIFSIEVADTICARLATGEPLSRICRDDGMPSLTTVYKWLRECEDFAKNYARAREDQADTLADETLEISDDGTNDWMASNDPDNPGYKLNGEHVQRSKLRVDARKWAAAHLRPKKYGDLKQVELSGPDGAPLATVNLNTTDPAEASRVYQTLLSGK